jgi:hypothetical protein|tara:strand:+ start:355 stop:483 length:129 start_codon:yes stop_codon:yes gene_type:complete
MLAVLSMLIAVASNDLTIKAVIVVMMVRVDCCGLIGALAKDI